MQEWPQLDIVHKRLLNDSVHKLVPLEACTSVRGCREAVAVPSDSSSWTLLSRRHMLSMADKTDGGGAQPTRSTAKQGMQGGWRSTADKVDGGAWPMRTTAEEGRCGSWGVFPILSGTKFDTAVTNHSQPSLLLLCSFFFC